MTRRKETVPFPCALLRISQPYLKRHRHWENWERYRVRVTDIRTRNDGILGKGQGESLNGLEEEKPFSGTPAHEI
jgi:hypothetical protein